MDPEFENIPPKPSDSSWSVETREELVKNRWYNFFVDKGKTDTGRDFEYYFINKPKTVAVIAVTKGQKLILVEQYRYPVNSRSVEVPGGAGKEGEKTEDLARRELLEETGYESKHLMHIGQFAANSGYSNEQVQVYLANNCTKSGDQALEETEEGLEVKLFPVEEVFELVQEQKIQDGFTLAALMIAWPHLL